MSWLALGRLRSVAALGLGLLACGDSAHVDLFRSFAPSSPGCDASRHEISSDGRFGVMVWGTDYYASYGYPAGGNVGTINEVVVVPEVPE
jgi:hypothetical protein